MSEANGLSVQQHSNMLFDEMIKISEQPGWSIRHIQDQSNKQILFFAEHASGLVTNTLAVGYNALKQFDEETQTQFNACIEEEIQLSKKMINIVKAFIDKKKQKKLIAP